ncbi:MAG: aspartyl protease family protein, partial [Bacteroidota bacterium]
VLIPLVINGSFEMSFILDTGVRTTILTEPMLANFLDLDSMRTIKVRGLGDGEPLDAKLADNVSISLPGGVQGRGFNLLVLPEGLASYSEMFGKPVYGIIGYEIFNRFGVEINYQREYIRLWDPFRMPKLRRWESVPMVLRRGKPYVDATLVDHEGQEWEKKWLIDTGASMAVSLFEDDLSLPHPHIEAFLGKGLNGNVYGKLGRSPSFRIGGFEMNEVITGFPDPNALGFTQNSTGEIWYGNIGAEVISRFRVFFDYPHRMVYIKKTPELDRRFEYNVSGLEILTVGSGYDTFIISYVRPGSPAEQAGLMVNDEVLGVNGLSIQGQAIDEVYDYLSKKPGKTLYLKVKRGDQVLKKRFRLKAEI